MFFAAAVWLWVGSAMAAPIEQTVLQIDWSALKGTDQLKAGQVTQADGPAGEASLVIEHDADEARTINLMTIDQPPVTRRRFALLGEVRHEGLDSSAMLELWLYFGRGQVATVRTADDQGLLGQLTGASDWRAFALPFFNRTRSGQPEQLALRVAFEGPGRVELSSLRLVELQRAPLWTSAGISRAILITLLSLMIGIGGALIAANHRFRWVRSAALVAMLGLGAAMVLGGVLAAARGSAWSGGLVIGGMGLTAWPILIARVLWRRSMGRAAGSNNA